MKFSNSDAFVKVLNEDMNNSRKCCRETKPQEENFDFKICTVKSLEEKPKQARLSFIAR